MRNQRENFSHHQFFKSMDMDLLCLQKRFKLDRRVFHRSEDQIPTASGVGGQSRASSLFSISIDITICRYAGSAERRRKWKFFRDCYCGQFFQTNWTISGEEYDLQGVHKCTSTMGINFWCSERYTKRWRFTVYVQDGREYSFLTPL